MKNVLIDTDVILDFFFDREPFSDDSTEIISLCETKKINGFITPVMVSNLYYLLRKQAPHKKVIEKLTLLLQITDVLIMDKNIILNAITSEFKDFKDALQNFAAVENGTIETIITRNIKDYKKSEIAVLTPETFLKLI